MNLLSKGNLAPVNFIKASSNISFNLFLHA